MAKFDFKTKLELSAPKLTIKKDDSKKMVSAMKRAVTRGAQLGTSYVAKDLKIALDKAMSSSIWNWPRETSRRSGKSVGSPRDIVDTGKLKSSLKLKESFTQKGSKIAIAYGAPYAALVHYGGAIQPYGNRNANTVLIPARPWIDATLKGTNGLPKFDMQKYYEKGINEAWAKQFG